MERWRAIPGYEGFYEVSDQGQVRSLDRVVPLGFEGHRRRHAGTVLRPTALKSGHLYVTLSKESVPVSARIHRLVLEAFVGPCPAGMQGCHYDGNPANNHLDNLRWDTPKANQQDAIRHGTAGQMRKTHCPYGHEYTPENTFKYNNCRQCKACASRRNKAKHAASIAARIAAGEVIRPPKTHCPQGHEYSAENTAHLKRGGRRCRECHRQSQRMRSATKRAALKALQTQE